MILNNNNDLFTIEIAPEDFRLLASNPLPTERRCALINADGVRFEYVVPPHSYIAVSRFTKDHMARDAAESAKAAPRTEDGNDANE